MLFSGEKLIKGGVWQRRRKGRGDDGVGVAGFAGTGVMRWRGRYHV